MLGSMISSQEVDLLVKEIFQKQACLEAGGNLVVIGMDALRLEIEAEAVKLDAEERRVRRLQLAGYCGQDNFSLGGQYWVKCGELFQGKRIVCRLCINKEQKMNKK